MGYQEAIEALKAGPPSTGGGISGLGDWNDLRGLFSWGGQWNNSRNLNRKPQAIEGVGTTQQRVQPKPATIEDLASSGAIVGNLLENVPGQLAGAARSGAEAALDGTMWLGGRLGDAVDKFSEYKDMFADPYSAIATIETGYSDPSLGGTPSDSTAVVDPSYSYARIRPEVTMPNYSAQLSQQSSNLAAGMNNWLLNGYMNAGNNVANDINSAFAQQIPLNMAASQANSDREVQREALAMLGSLLGGGGGPSGGSTPAGGRISDANSGTYVDANSGLYHNPVQGPPPSRQIPGGYQMKAPAGASGLAQQYADASRAGGQTATGIANRDIASAHNQLQRNIENRLAMTGVGLADTVPGLRLDQMKRTLPQKQLLANMATG